MISLEQIRAARGLLDWSQRDLAHHAGISTTSIVNMHRGHLQPRVKTLERLHKVFEDHGIEFTEGDGVRFRNKALRVQAYEGPMSITIYLRDLIETQLARGGEGLHSCRDETYFIKHHREALFNYYQAIAKHNLKERVLIGEGIVERYGPASTTEYRRCSGELFSQIGYSVYGDKYCIFLTDRIVVIENQSVAEAYRRQFEENWKRAKPVTAGKSLYEQDLEPSGTRRTPWRRPAGAAGE